MNNLKGQLKHVLRRLLRSPLFTGITLVTIAIAIGANTAIFSVVNGVLLKPLAYPDPERLVAVWHTAPGINLKELNESPATYFTYREESRAFTDIGIWQNDSVSVTGLAEPEQVEAIDLTDGVLPLLGVRPVLGHNFTRKEDSPGSPLSIMLSYGYWQHRFGGDRSVIGRRLIVDGKAREVIGVLPRDFKFMNGKPDLFLPLQLKESDTVIGNFSFVGIARLKPGVSIAQANRDVARMLPIMLRKFRPAPGMSLEMFENARIGPNIRALKQDIVGDVGKVLWLLMATVGIVLLIACANVANLLLVRTEGRQQELATRAALGAGWMRIARQLLLESMTLGIIGGVCGLALAYAALRLLIALAPAQLPRLNEISIDPLVLLFTTLISVFAGFLFGVIPVMKYAAPQLGTTLRESGRSLTEGRERHRARNTLVIVQVALALVLLISSGLMIRTLQALRQVQPGFTHPEQILTVRVYVPEAQVKEPDRVVRLYSDMVRKIAAVPGVSAVGLTNSITMQANTENDPIFVEDKPYPEGQVPPLRRYKFISPNLFHTMGNPLLAGRDLTWNDVYDKRNVVLISENLAREYWHEPPAAIGKKVRENPKAPWHEIIGVVGNERDDGVNQKPVPLVYWPMILSNFWGESNVVRRNLTFAIRSSRTGSASFLNDIRNTIWSVNRNLPLADVRTVKEIYDKSMARTSFTLVMLALAGGMALLLGLIGIYGVISYSIAQRTREIGIRIALGAPQRSVRQMFVRHALVLTCIGVVLGLLAAGVETRLMSSLLFEVNPLDPITYAGVSFLLASAALLASYLPARRATLIDPTEALRAQ